MKKLLLCLVVSTLGFFNFALAEDTNVAYLNQLAHPVVTCTGTDYDTTCQNFCALFEAETRANCETSKNPPPPSKAWCEKTAMATIYKDMLLPYGGSLDKACKAQDPQDVQGCIDDWNCYILGGKDSKGQLCSGTGAVCTDADY